MKNRIVWIDSIKGLAMFSVVLCHVVNGYYTSGLFPEFNTSLYAIQNVMNSYQMPLFCIISGYLFFKSYVLENGEININRVKKQIMNFTCLYVLWCVIMGGFKIVLSEHVNHEVSFNDLFMIWCRPIGVYWYLYVLIAIYIIMCKFIKIDPKYITLFAVFSGILGSIMQDDFLGGLFSIRRILYYFFFFFYGSILARYSILKKYNKLVLMILIETILLMIGFWDTETELYHIPVVNLFIALGICNGLILIAESVKPFSNNLLFNIWGRNSLEIYVLHVFITAGSRVVITKLGMHNIYICILITLILSLFIPILIGALARKLKIYSLFFKPYMGIQKLITNKR